MQNIDAIDTTVSSSKFTAREWAAATWRWHKRAATEIAEAHGLFIARSGRLVHFGTPADPFARSCGTAEILGNLELLRRGGYPGLTSPKVVPRDLVRLAGDNGNACAFWLVYSTHSWEQAHWALEEAGKGDGL